MGYELVNDDPLVKLLIQPHSFPDKGLADILDYGKSDDEIVGCCYRYAQDNPLLDVRLLTHDTGPMMSAKNVDLPFIPIDDDWLIPSEHNESERKITRLEGELSRLKKSEPEFEVMCINEQGEEVASLDFTYRIFQSLSYEEVSTFLEILENHFPPVTEFTRSSPKPIGDPFIRYKYVPPSQAEILKYQNEEYSDWLNACESFLYKLHENLQEEELLYFCFAAKNSGIQPAQDALVVVCAKGSFKIRPPKYVDEDDQEQDGTDLHLPAPPRIPQGKWTQTHRTLLGVSAYDFGTGLDNRLFALPDASLLTSINRGRDPNAFYYKPERSDVPAECFRLECEQWRHAMPVEWFEGVIAVEEGETQIKGALEFSIHAKNLPEPARKLIPVKIDIESVSTKTFARQLIDEMESAPSRRS